MKLQQFGAFVVALVVSFVLTLGVAQADTFKLGPKWVDGHSYDGTYGVNNKGEQSWGFGASYDHDWLNHKINKHQAIGVDLGAMASYYHLTITVNASDGDGGYQQHGQGDYKIETVNSAVLGVYPKFWYELYGVRTYIAPIVGTELADDGGSSVMIGGMIGFEKELYKGIGLNIQHEELWTMERRFDTTSANLMYRF